MNTIQPLESFIIAILLAEGKINTTVSGREIHFPFQKRKMQLLNGYIHSNKISQHITLNEQSYTGIIHQSIILEKMLKDWAKNGEIVAINPIKINPRVFILSLCLFGKKTKQGVELNTVLNADLRSTVLSLVNIMLPCKLRIREKAFYLKPFLPIVLESVRLKMSLLETAELNYLLPDKERGIFKEKLVNERGAFHVSLKEL